MEQNESEKCLTCWVSGETAARFERETEHLGLSKSQVLRQLVKRWLAQRKNRVADPLEV